MAELRLAGGRNRRPCGGYAHGTRAVVVPATGDRSVAIAGAVLRVELSEQGPQFLGGHASQVDVRQLGVKGFRLRPPGFLPDGRLQRQATESENGGRRKEQPDGRIAAQPFQSVNAARHGCVYSMVGSSGRPYLFLTIGGNHRASGRISSAGGNRG